NVHELPALVRKAADLGIDEVYLQRLVYSGKGLATEDEALFRRAGSDDLDAIKAAQALATTLGVRLRGSGEVSALESLSDADADLPYQACRRPWSLMYLTANGN